jgi:hypothetical protein
VTQRRRADDQRIAMERVSSLPGTGFGCSFADEVAIDFPSVSEAIERMQIAFIERDDSDRLRAEITVSRREAGRGVAVPLDVPVRWTCSECGGRGEVWGDACPGCDGHGHALHNRRFTVSVPPGVADGDRFRFSVTPARGPRTRVELRVAVT